MSKITGLTVGETQKLEYAFKQSGTSIEEMKRPLQTMAKFAFDDSTKFKGLGVSVKDVNGNLKDSGVLFEETITKISGIKNTTERAAIAHQIFGRSTAGVLTLIASGVDNFKRYGDEAARLGLILSDKTVKQLEETKRTTLMLDKVMQVTSANIAVTFTPTLIKIAELAMEASVAIKDMFSQVNKQDISNDLAKNKIEDLKNEQKNIQETIDLAKQKGQTEVTLFTNGNNGRRIKLVVAQAEIEAIKAQIGMNEKLIISEKKVSQASIYNPEDFKDELEKKKKFQNEALKAQAKALEEGNKYKNPGFTNEYDEEQKLMEKTEQVRLSLLEEKNKSEWDSLQVRATYNIENYEFTKSIYEQEIDAINNKYDRMNQAGANFAMTEAARTKALNELKLNMAASFADRSIQNLETIGKASKANAQIMKRLAQGQAIVSGALAANRALENPIPIVRWIDFGLTVAVTAGQVALIEQQQFARGTYNASGGRSLVGEHGPEYADIPQGTRIYTATETKNMQRISNNSGHTFNVFLQSDNGNTIDRLFMELRSGTANADKLINFISQKVNN